MITRKDLLIVLFSLPAIGLFGQKAIMDIHLLGSSSTRNIQYESGTTMGGGLALDFYVNDYFSLGLEADYLGFRYPGGDSTVNIIPFQGLISAHWPVGESFSVFAGSGVGAFLQRYKNRFEVAENEILMGISPRIGFNYEFAQDVFLNFGGRYTLGLQKSEYDDASGILMISLGLGYNIMSDF